MIFDKESMRIFVDIFAKCFMPLVNANSHFSLARNGNQAVEQYEDPWFRNTLRYLAGWYREGLIFPDSLTQSRQQLGALAAADIPVAAVSTSNAANNNGTGKNRKITGDKGFPLVSIGLSGQGEGLLPESLRRLCRGVLVEFQPDVVKGPIDKRRDVAGIYDKKEIVPLRILFMDPAFWYDSSKLPLKKDGGRVCTAM